MEQTSVRKLARVLRVLVMIVFVCSIFALFLVPPLALLESLDVDGAEFMTGLFLGSEESIPRFLMVVLTFWVSSFGEVFWEQYGAVLTLFLWVCGVCAACILWQGKRVLDSVLGGDPFTLQNALSLSRAAGCCFVISGAALVRLIWGLAYYRSIAPLLTYNALFVPAFLMGGLLFMVMSALFLQAARLKAENDLTI